MHINFNSFISAISHAPLQFIKKNVTSIVGIGLAAIGIFGANLFRKSWHSGSYTMPTDKKVSVSKQKETKSTQVFNEKLPGHKTEEKKSGSYPQPTSTQRAVANELEQAMKASLKRRGRPIPGSKTETNPSEQTEVSPLKTSNKPIKKKKKQVKWKDLENEKEISSPQSAHAKSKSKVIDKPKNILKSKKNSKAEGLENSSKTGKTLLSLTRDRVAPSGRRPPSRKPKKPPVKT